MNDVLEFQVAFGAVRHFGRNLYTTNPPAITELIANAWDAYANNCVIFPIDDGLVIFDDGIGMNFDELENNYAKSGNSKDVKKVRIPENMIENPRKYMGRKGIGKFAAFSLGDSYHIITKSAQCNEWRELHLTYDLLDSGNAIIPIKIKRHKSIKDFNEKIYTELTSFLKKNQGTCIYIPKLTRSITGATMKSLKTALPRRFSSIVMKEGINFDLFVENLKEPLNLQKHFYYDNIESLYLIGFEEGTDETEGFINKFKVLEKSGINFINKIYFTERSIKGWIGTVETSSDLEQDDTAINGVAIYINGKIADTNVFREKKDASMVNTYLVGAIDADFLQTDEIDPVLSSREGLNHELPEVKRLRDELQKVKNRAINSWNEFRRNRKEAKQQYLQEILEVKEFNELYDILSKEKKEDFKRLSQKIFDGNKNLKSLIPIYTPALFTMVNDNSLEKIKLLDDLDNEVDMIDVIDDFFESAEINYALRLKANFKNRLQVIEQLEQCQEDEEIERVFQKHLYRNPWLINPAWDIVDSTKIEMEKNSNIQMQSRNLKVGLI